MGNFGTVGEDFHHYEVLRVVLAENTFLGDYLGEGGLLTLGPGHMRQTWTQGSPRPEMETNEIRGLGDGPSEEGKSHLSPSIWGDLSPDANDDKCPPPCLCFASIHGWIFLRSSRSGSLGDGGGWWTEE